jgi:hypothetical protein
MEVVTVVVGLLHQTALEEMVVLEVVDRLLPPPELLAETELAVRARTVVLEHLALVLMPLVAEAVVVMQALV